jgi:outer membrane protein TolC
MPSTLRRVALFGSLALIATIAGAAETTVLTLEQVLTSVEKTNLTVLLSREAVVQALEQATATRAGILPIVTGTLQQRRTKSVPLTNTGATSPRPTNRFDALLNGSYSLVDLQRWSATRSSRLGAEVSQADYNAVVQAVLASVAQSYFTHLRNLRRLEVLDANITRARSLLDLARNQLTAGVATQIDVTRAEAQLAQAEQARLQQVTADLQSELLLKRAIDVPVSRPLQLEDFKVRRSDGTLLIFAEDKTTFEKRADYLRAQKAVEQARADVRTATFERLPTLSLGGTYGRGAPNFDDTKMPQWSVTGLVSMPIFDGLRAGADRRVALSRQRSQEARLHNLELQISAELRLAAQDASSRNAQITVAEKSLTLAQEELRLAQQRYQQGVADNREVVEAQNRLAIADDNYVEAIYQFNLSRLELARARGDVRTVLMEKTP